MGVNLATELKAALDPKTSAALGKTLGLYTVGDLLRHYPRRYEQFGQLTSIADLPDATEEVSVMARVVSAATRPMRHRRGMLLEVVITDGTDELDVTFFSAYGVTAQIKPGREVLLSGKVGWFRDRRQLRHPSVVAVGSDAQGSVADLHRPIPIYPASAAMSSEKLRIAVGTVLDIIDELDDPLPAAIRDRHELPGLRLAFERIHRPEDQALARQAQRRFRYEEALVLQTALARRRALLQAETAVPRVAQPDGILAAFDERLPFALTEGQREVGAQIAANLAATHPMHRMLQGEVGSGKTVVALRAMLTVVDAGGQAVLLAPTEVLAAQHHASITALLGDLASGGMLGGDSRGTHVALLTGSLSTAARRAALSAMATGEAGIIIGTHALLADQVQFFDVGLVVVDEQHRFGVDQRDAIRAKGVTSPHMLVMTATPIPRTVAMTVFGDVEISTLTELPKGRGEIRTHVVPMANDVWYQRIWQRAREEIAAGRQVYVVCPRIGSDEEEPAGPGLYEDAESERQLLGVLEMFEQLQHNPDLVGMSIGVLHGRLPAAQRAQVMADFAAGTTSLLVATTIIEVGVDVPNATMMVIVDADRFGVSQLHQLRGRVGRGSHGGVCMLVSPVDTDSPAGKRLSAVSGTVDGFELARFDLDQRREGDVLGARQSGGTSLRLLRVIRDEKLIELARVDATALVAADPELTQHPILRAAIDEALDADREAYLERS